MNLGMVAEIFCYRNVTGFFLRISQPNAAGPGTSDDSTCDNSIARERTPVYKLTCLRVSELYPVPFLAGLIYALVFWAAVASWILPETIAWRVKRATGSAEGRDKGSLTLIVVLWWIGIALDFSLSFLLPQAAISWERTT